MTLHEIAVGPLSAENARRMREEGGLAFETTLTTDSMSLWAAIAAASVKVPAEKNLAVHLFWLRELLGRAVLTRLRWTDTRDMTADGHTKGSIDRSVLRALAEGALYRAHPCKRLVLHGDTGASDFWLRSPLLTGERRV